MEQNGFNVNIPNIDNIVRQVQQELNNSVSPFVNSSQYWTDQVNKAINSVVPGQGNFINPLNSFSNGGSGSLTNSTQRDSNSTQRDKAVSVAHQQVGKPYVYGASGPNSFDCSGLIQYVYNQIGVSIPRVSNVQLSSGSPVNSVSQLRPGDIVGYYGGGHVGVYIGNGNIIHAPESGQNVKIVPVNSMSISSMRTIL